MKTVVWIGIPEHEVLCAGRSASERVARMRTEPDHALMVGHNSITAIRINGEVVGIGHPVAPELVPALDDAGLQGTAVTIIADCLKHLGIRGPVGVRVHAEV